MKKISYGVLTILLLIVFVGVFAFINQDKLIDRFISRQSAAAQYRYELLATDDKIRLVTVGTGSPLPGKRTRSCNAVFVNGHFFVFDVGPGASRAMEQMRLPMDRIEAIFITHWHADHFIDLPELVNRSWLLNRKNLLNVYGPDPIDTIMNGMAAFLYKENEFREAHHGREIIQTELANPISNKIHLDDDGYSLVYDKDGIQIEAFSVDHSPISPALGYRITFREKSLVISGDTKRSEQVIKYAQEADILLHEALAFEMLQRAIRLQTEAENVRNATILKDILDYHTSPVEAASVAAEARVKKLILTHLGPAPENPISRRFYAAGAGEVYEGPILLAEDGDLFIIE